MIRILALVAVAASLSAGASVPAFAQSNPGFGTCFGLMLSNPADHAAQCGTFRDGMDASPDSNLSDGDCSSFTLSYLRGLAHGESVLVAEPEPQKDPCAA